MKNILITGATGMIGNLVLEECLKNDEISKVTIIVRKPTGKKHAKLKEIIHKDFLDFSSISQAFENIDISYFCLGVYTGAVDRKSFRTITVEYTKSFANLLKEKSPHVSFVFLSGMGADRSEKSSIAFAKDKGVAENYLLSCKFEKLFIFRPGYIYPVIPRIEPNLSYKIYRKLYPLMNLLFPSVSVTSTHLSKAMFKTGLFGESSNTYENKDIRALHVKNLYN